MQPSIHQRINARAIEARSRFPQFVGDPMRLARAGRVVAYREPGEVNRAHDGERWIENASRLGWRVMGPVHELSREINRMIGHNGWFTSPNGDTGETIHGVLIRLPATRGCNRYLIGQSDPCNDDCYLILDSVETASREDSGEEEALCDLARQADRFAERSAEKEREFHEADQGLRSAKERMGEARVTVSEHLDVLRGHRAMGLVNHREHATALQHLEFARVDYTEARDVAMDALADAKRHGIGWRDV